MNEICLNEMGVQEMTAHELVETDGGIWPILLLLGLLLLLSTNAN